MISSLFGKTRPANYVLALSFLTLFFALAHFGLLREFSGVEKFLEKLLSLACLLFSVFVVNFIVQRNQLTGTNSYAVLFYCLFIPLFPDSLIDTKILFATFFLLLAERRLISMRSLKNSKEKIFDGALWIFAASLFINWMIVFSLLVWVYIYFYEPKNLRYWIIPIAAALVVGMMGWSVSFLLGDPEYLFRHYTFSFQIYLFEEMSITSLIKIAVFLAVVILAVFISFLKLSGSGHGKLTQMRLLALGWLFGVAVLILNSERYEGAIMLTFMPSAVFMTKYVESIKREFIRELVFTGTLLISLGAFFAQWVLK